uniref:HIRA-interacting protein 3 n=1 Tax=Cacopsylla melanoneura TaxID=428564 RepID=A0A8D8RAZ3_9HEMI
MKKVKSKDIKKKSNKKEVRGESGSEDEKNESTAHDHNVSNSSDSEPEKKETKSSKSSKQKNPHNDPRIVRLKKYLSLAGIRINCYAEFWEDCKSIKAKQAKMVQHMQKLGLKGVPTKASCAKLRKKLERKREIEALDMSNILDTPEKTYRGKRTRNTASSKAAADPDDSDEIESAAQKTEERERQYARLRLLASSSDED